MRKFIAAMTFLFVFGSLITSAFAASSTVSTRIKDIAKVQGVRSNQLVGYGLVVGLAGTGDSNKTLETLQSVSNMLKEFGVSISTAQLKTKNVAAVMVTAQLPPFVREGDTIDITVSSMGDAKSIQGGTLLQTPLKAANGQVYAVGQGAVSTGGFAAGSGGTSVQKNFPTVGITPNGGIVERSVETNLASNGMITLSLRKADFTTATRIANAVNSQYGGIATASNPGRIDITVPYMYQNDVVGFVANIEDLYVTPDNIAKVVVNERTGTIVMGGNIAVDEVAIAQGSLNISVTKNTDVNQPPPFSMGETVETKNTDVNVDEEKAHTIVLPATANVSDVVGALNAVGATSRDIISILQAIKAAGALHADLEII
ncbi:flagellar basal body P-ring protein FlgI [Anaerosinus massiliensis]|uniref:flagellar basal body P-ring protein FlgI n=1 Tax=Massilibacillus massiliensis TaxID=1806837 RepID=UPI000AB288B1|nr:flagellar basal body P-ring protein FlgI [Massilibacillus massiliensis]